MILLFWAIHFITVVSQVHATTHDHECAVEMTNEMCDLYDVKCGSKCNEKPNNEQWVGCMKTCLVPELEKLECSQRSSVSGTKNSFLSNMITFMVNNKQVNYECVTKTSCSIWRYCSQHFDAVTIETCLINESRSRFDTCVIGTEHSNQGATEYTCYKCDNCAFFLPPVYKDEDCFDSFEGCCLSLDGCFTHRDTSGTVNRGCLTTRDQCDTCSICHDSYCNDKRSAATAYSISFILLSLLLIHS